MQLTFLGTGAGMPSKERNTSSLVLEMYEERKAAWLFDCGEATQHQILRTHIKPRKIEKVFITHMHGDHIFGLPGFLSSRSFLAGEDELTVYGPKGVKAFIEMNLTLSETHIKYPIHIVEILEDGVIFEDGQFIVEAMELEHIIPTYGFRIIQKPLQGEFLVEKAVSLGIPKGPLFKQLKEGHSVTLPNGKVVQSEEVVAPPRNGLVIAILGDTKFSAKSIQLAKDADVLVHEATFDHTTYELAQNYGHSTNIEAATIALKANVKALILNHISARFQQRDLKKLHSEAKNVFPQTYVADDFTQFDIKTLLKNK